MNFSIGKFSQMMDLSIYTLRYYEQLKLIVPARKDNGQRYYSDEDAAWVQFIKRLKDTGMPVKEIQIYSELRSQGDPTMPQRMELLVKHRAALKDEIARLQDHLENLDNKIDYYRAEIIKQRNPAA